jgi:hypothetical protein
LLLRNVLQINSQAVCFAVAQEKPNYIRSAIKNAAGLSRNLKAAKQLMLEKASTLLGIEWQAIDIY